MYVIKYRTLFLDVHNVLRVINCSINFYYIGIDNTRAYTNVVITTLNYTR